MVASGFNILLEKLVANYLFILSFIIWCLKNFNKSSKYY